MSTVLEWDGREALPDLHGSCATLGNFDGMHLGHQALLRGLVRWARQTDRQSMVLTFTSHPRQVLGDSRPRLLMPLEDRLSLISRSGVDTILVMPFTREFSLMPAEEFLQRVLAGYLGVSGVLLGWDSCFGHNRRGNLAFLQEHGPALGIEARGAEPVLLDHAPISSSRIRHALETGDLAAAERLLGRRVSISGMVVEGDGRGQGLGIPTANLQPGHDVLVPGGVYGGLAFTEDDCCHPALVNIGTRPTFTAHGPPVVEAWLQEFSGDLYGLRLTLELLGWIREERRFPDGVSLVHAIHQDRAQLELMLSALPHPPQG